MLGFFVIRIKLQLQGRVRQKNDLPFLEIKFIGIAGPFAIVQRNGVFRAELVGKIRGVLCVHTAVSAVDGKEGVIHAVLHKLQHVVDHLVIIEEQSTENLLAKLPVELKSEFSEIFENIEKDSECYRLLKAADRLCAYIKCMEEEKYNNSEFSSARKGIEEKLEETKKELPELEYFMEKFLPAFDLTLDQQQEI